jgi:hypothetical protein
VAASKSMDVFSLRESVVGEYKKFATSFTKIHAEDIRGQVDAIYAQNRYWPEPLIQLNPSYKASKNVEELVAERVRKPVMSSPAAPALARDSSGGWQDIEANRSGRSGCRDGERVA